MSTSLVRHLEKLCVEIGARPIGSPANDRAADYIRDVFAALGWAVEEQPYACTGWDCAAASLAVGDEALAVEANAFSPACDVTAPAVPASTLDELAAADLTGKIALLHGELVSWPLSPKSWFLKESAMTPSSACWKPNARPPCWPRRRPRSSMSSSPAIGSWRSPRPPRRVPVIERLLAQPGVLHLRLDCAKYAATARNIVARKAAAFRQAQGSFASESADRTKRVTVMAHFDTRINTPGALDNGGGVAALLGAGRSPGRARPALRSGAGRVQRRGVSADRRRRVRAPGRRGVFRGDPAGRQHGWHRLYRRQQHHRPVQHRAGAGRHGWPRRWTAIPRCRPWSRGRRATIRPSPSAASRRWRSAATTPSPWPTSRPTRSRR